MQPGLQLLTDHNRVEILVCQPHSLWVYGCHLHLNFKILSARDGLGLHGTLTKVQSMFFELP